MKIDWLDILLRSAVAGLVVPLAHFGFAVPVWSLVLANFIVWPARELWQHRPDYSQIFTHEQSLLEWLTPSAVSVIVTLLILWGQK